MECPIQYKNVFNDNGELPGGWSDLSIIINETFNELEQSLLTSTLKEFSFDVKEDDDPLFCDRNAVMEKTKLTVINETLNSLKLFYSNLARNRIFDNFLIESIPRVMKTKMENVLKNLLDIFDLLDNNAKSPYDLEAIFDPEHFKQSLKVHPTNNPQDRASSMIKLAQQELEIIKESSKTNEMQKAILKCHLDMLKTLDGQLLASPASSIASTSSFKKKSKSSNKSNNMYNMCEIMKKCQRLIKDVYGLLKISTAKDYYVEKNEIFNVINGKGCESIDDVCEFIERKKDKWIGHRRDDTSVDTARKVALRKLNSILKLVKKLKTIKDNLEPAHIILGLKNIVTETLHIDKIFDFYYSHIDLTHIGYRKVIVVPENFTRDDPVYQEINESPVNALFIVYYHVRKYVKDMESLDWNPFQRCKPWGTCGFYLEKMQWLVLDALRANFNQDEQCALALFIADRFLMTKQKIEYDRKALEFRFDRFKPLKPHRFSEIYKIVHMYHDPRSGRLLDELGKLGDDLEDKIVRKVTNKGQFIVNERAMAMMKRSMIAFRIIRRVSAEYWKLIKQFLDEYLYAVETAVKLLDLLRPNRRITFSFSASGPFANKIDSIGLTVKDELLETINSQIKKLKVKIKEKETDLEPVQDEKIQLRYLKSISNRVKSVPINELEMTEEDNIVILREIIEEYEFIMIQYGPIAIS